MHVFPFRACYISCPSHSLYLITPESIRWSSSYAQRHLSSFISWLDVTLEQNTTDSFYILYYQSVIFRLNLMKTMQLKNVVVSTRDDNCLGSRREWNWNKGTRPPPRAVPPGNEAGKIHMAQLETINWKWEFQSPRSQRIRRSSPTVQQMRNDQTWANSSVWLIWHCAEVARSRVGYDRECKNRQSITGNVWKSNMLHWLRKLRLYQNVNIPSCITKHNAI